MNVKKDLYEKYNKAQDTLVDIISEYMREKKIDDEVMSEILRSDPRLLLIYKTECEMLGLTKQEKPKLSLDSFF